MTRDEIIAKLRAMEPELRARGITRMRMFGSRARGDARPDSDLDLLVDMDPTLAPSIFDLAGLHLDLTEQFGIETQLTPNGLAAKPRFIREISDDLVDIFPATDRPNRSKVSRMSAQRRIAHRLIDILEAIADIRGALEGETLDSFAADRIRTAAVHHLLLVISEASRHVPDEIKTGSAEVPWAKISGIGNILRHGYFKIDGTVVWDIYVNHLDALEAAIRRAQAGLPDVEAN